MAGIIPTPGKSGRKQWTLHDGPRGSLRRLRNQLAEDGCPESQVILAKQLLEEECELEIDKMENARAAVKWLIKSSEQGNDEATKLLKKCLLTNTGICKENYKAVQSCINMSQNEKLARKAAREVFASLSQGEDFITPEQLEKRMLDIYKNVKITDENSSEEEIENNENDIQDRSLNSQNNVSHSNHVSVVKNLSNRNELDYEDLNQERLTEDNLVDAARNYAHGELPEMNGTLCLTKPNPTVLNHLPYAYRTVLHPFLTFQIVYYKLVDFLTCLPTIFLKILHSNFNIIFMLTFYIIFIVENKLVLIMLLGYYFSYLIMILTTFQMINIKHEFQDFCIWSGLFLQYSMNNINSDEVEYQFIRNKLKPYVQFFAALLVNLLLYSLISDQWAPESELTIVSLCLMFLTLIIFMKKEKYKQFPDYFLLFSFAINVLAKYPYDSDFVVTQGWRFLDLNVPSFTSYVIGNGIDFCVTFRTVFLYTIPFCFLKLAFRDNFKGVYKYLIPHCVTLSWLQLAIISSRGATMYGLLRGTLALVGLVLFLPLTTLATILLPIIAILNWVYESDYLYTILIATIFTGTLVIVSLLLNYLNLELYVNKFQVFCTILFSLGMIIYYTYNESSKNSLSPMPTSFDSVEESLQMDTYLKLCGDIANAKDSNIISKQLKCFQLDNVLVKWEGYVQQIKIKQINNRIKSIIDIFPIIIQEKLYCYFGEENKNKYFEEALECLNSLNYSHLCHLHAYDKYIFDIDLKISTGVWTKPLKVHLIANNNFKNFTMSLQNNDKLAFIGYLKNPIENEPQIEIVELECVNCQNSQLKGFKLNQNLSLIDVKYFKKIAILTFKHIFKFFFNSLF